MHIYKCIYNILLIPQYNVVLLSHYPKYNGLLISCFCDNIYNNLKTKGDFYYDRFRQMGLHRKYNVFFR